MKAFQDFQMGLKIDYFKFVSTSRVLFKYLSKRLTRPTLRAQAGGGDIVVWGKFLGTFWIR